MHLRLAGLAGALTALLCAAPALAADRYLAPDGTDAGACTSAVAPCFSLDHVNAALQEGDTVHFAAGDYTAANVSADAKYLEVRGVVYRGPRAGETAVGRTGPEATLPGGGNGPLRIMATDVVLDGLRIGPAADTQFSAIVHGTRVTIRNTAFARSATSLVSADGELTLTDSTLEASDTALDIESGIAIVRRSVIRGDRGGLSADEAYAVLAEDNDIRGGAPGYAVTTHRSGVQLYGNLLTGPEGVGLQALGDGPVSSRLVVADDNWWGCNAGPGATGCSRIIGDGRWRADTWLTLTASAEPSTIPVGQTTTLTASLARNSLGAETDYGRIAGLRAFFSSDGGIFSAPSAAFGPDGASIEMTAGGVPATINWRATVGAAQADRTVTVTAPPVPAVSPDRLTFDGQAPRTTSTPQTVTVTNPGPAGMSIDRLRRHGTGNTLFAISDDTCTGATLAAGASCTFAVAFAPERPGTWTPRIAVEGDGAPAAVRLRGTAGSAFAMSPGAIDFGRVARGRTTSDRYLLLTNTGGQPLTLETPRITGTGASLFRLSGSTCPATLPAGEACALAVTFAPLAVGSWSPTFTVATSAGTAKVALGGEGVPPVDVEPGRLDFGTVAPGTSSAPRTLTVVNRGGATVAVQSVRKDGTGGSLFAVGDDGCSGRTVAPGASCSLTVIFSPPRAGTWSPQVVVRTDARTIAVPLTGSGG